MNRSRVIAAVFALAVMAAALLPSPAAARPVDSTVSATMIGTIDSRGAIRYLFTGEVAAERLTFPCMTRRQVVLFKIGPEGGRRKVASARTNFLGEFTALIESPVAAIPGHYFVKAKPRVRNMRRGRLRCLGARSPTFLVEVPAGLTE